MYLHVVQQLIPKQQQICSQTEIVHTHTILIMASLTSVSAPLSCSFPVLIEPLNYPILLQDL